MTRAALGTFSDLVRRGLVGLVKGYRLFLSSWLGASCRFAPTCSAYAIEALERHGAWGGGYLTLARLARCHPWCDGGIDEVPEYRTSRPGMAADASPIGGSRAAPSRRLFSRLLSPPSQKTFHE